MLQSARLANTDNRILVRANVAGGVLTEDHFVELVTVGGIVVGVLDNGQFTALLTDPRGTPFAGTDGNYNLASPYGVRASHLGISEMIDYTRLGWDPDLDVVRMGVRDYDAKLSQFLTPDPLYFENLDKCQSSPLQCSLYGYAIGNPVSFVDPTGNEGEKATNTNPHEPTTRIHLMFYLPFPGYSADSFVQTMHGSFDSDVWEKTSKFIKDGIDIVLYDNPTTARQDLKAALAEPGAVVVWMSHSSWFHGKPAHVLRPSEKQRKYDITFKQLQGLLKTANAKALIVASCNTGRSIGKVNGDTMIVTTNSGKDKKTWSVDWAGGLLEFFSAFIKGESLAKSIDAANVDLKKRQPDESFLIRSGDSSMTK